MTSRKYENQNKKVGELLKKYREQLTDIPKSRQAFIDDRSENYFDGEEWISERTLMNYEKGKNIPSLKSLKKLTIALEVDLNELINAIMPLI